MDLIPGFIQGFTRVTISYPFDVIKINMQKNKYDNTYSALKNILKRDPYLLYRGSSFSYLSVSSTRSLQYYWGERMNGKMNPYITGVLFGSFVSVYSVPISFITTNMALSDKKIGPFEIIKKKSIKELYKGYCIETPRSILQSSLYMGTYFHLRKKYNPNNNIYYTPFLSSTAALITWTTIFPIDTIKTDKQTTQNNSIISLVKNRYDIFGIKGFYKGLMPALYRASISASSNMIVYEFCRKYISNLKK